MDVFEEQITQTVLWYVEMIISYGQSGLYFLCNMAFRQTVVMCISFYLQIKMLLGTQAPRGSQNIFPSMEEMEERVNKMYK